MDLPSNSRAKRSAQSARPRQADRHESIPRTRHRCSRGRHCRPAKPKVSNLGTCAPKAAHQPSGLACPGRIMVYTERQYHMKRLKHLKNACLRTGQRSGITALYLKGEAGQDTYAAWMDERNWDMDTLVAGCAEDKWVWLLHPGIDIPNDIHLSEHVRLLADRTRLLVPPIQDAYGDYCTFDDPDLDVAPIPDWLFTLVFPREGRLLVAA